ncbi:cupin domain-containing protein [Halovulum sp. GXIMD14793]
MADENSKIEVVLPTTDLSQDLGFFTKTLGMRLDSIFPADDPSNASLSGHGFRLHLDRTAGGPSPSLQVLTDDPGHFSEGGAELTAPNGTRIRFVPLTPQLEQPTTQHEFAVRRLRDEAPWIIGRAGMHYRDLIPSRLGGSIIASHIRIPDGGPVPDMVHYHTVGFQLIYCYRGWVDVLYEDQGNMLRLTAGDCVTQPPEIRHRVCHASPDIEVIEIGVPAEHVTTIDHEMTLPNGKGDLDREWQGQKFVHHEISKAVWRPYRMAGFSCRDTGIAKGTKGIAGIKVARFVGGTPTKLTHEADINFFFVLEGCATLTADGHPSHQIEAGDAFVVPPGLDTGFNDCSQDFEVMEVTLPGA